ncbi:ABC-2 transporter permease [Bacillus sp. 1P06AnD]|uniref:ABC-2 transporter permease n=1 Tax=Bacillus sp. 1P06AnD TaxID=3132208 RepID=UPI0039A3C8BC
MFNLIVKDFFIHKKMLLGTLAGIVFYAFIDVSVMFVGVLFTFAMAMHIFSSDEKKSIQTLLSSLPYTRREVVSSKYVSVFVCLFLVMSVVVVSNYFINQEVTNWKQIYFITSVVMVLISFVFPFSYKFTSKYLLTASIGLFVLYLAVLKFLIPNLNDEIRSITTRIIELNNIQIFLGTGAILILFYVVSWILSVRIYEKKVF